MGEFDLYIESVGSMIFFPRPLQTLGQSYEERIERDSSRTAPGRYSWLK